MASLALLARLVTGVASCLGVSLPHPLYPAASTRYATISVDSSPRERCVHVLRHERALLLVWGRLDSRRSMDFAGCPGDGGPRRLGRVFCFLAADLLEVSLRWR